MTDAGRRLFLQGGLTAAALATISPALALDWNKVAFEARTVDNALRSLGAAPVASGEIKLEMPEIADDDKVRVTVTSRIADTQMIALLVKRNHEPLSGVLRLPKEADPRIEFDIRIERTSPVVVVVGAGGKYYSYSREIKATTAGCA